MSFGTSCSDNWSARPSWAWAEQRKGRDRRRLGEDSSGPGPAAVQLGVRLPPAALQSARAHRATARRAGRNGRQQGRPTRSRRRRDHQRDGARPPARAPSRRQGADQQPAVQPHHLHRPRPTAPAVSDRLQSHARLSDRALDDGHGISIGMTSIDGQACFGVYAHARLAHDADDPGSRDRPLAQRTARRGNTTTRHPCTVCLSAPPRPTGVTMPLSRHDRAPGTVLRTASAGLTLSGLHVCVRRKIALPLQARESSPAAAGASQRGHHRTSVLGHEEPAAAVTRYWRQCHEADRTRARYDATDPSP
jgi:hypothetical protein